MGINKCLHVFEAAKKWLGIQDSGSWRLSFWSEDWGFNSWPLQSVYWGGLGQDTKPQIAPEGTATGVWVCVPFGVEYWIKQYNIVDIVQWTGEMYFRFVATAMKKILGQDYFFNHDYFQGQKQTFCLNF